MKITNNQYFKVIPLKTLNVSADAFKKLNTQARMDNEDKLIDWRTPFYAVVNDSNIPVVKKSRISGISGYRPRERAPLIEECYKKILPALKNKDYIEGEEKFLKYRFSSRSVKLAFDRVFEGTILPYFKNAQKKGDTGADFGNQVFEEGEGSIRAVIPAHSLRPLDYDSAIDRLPATTSGGMPFMKSGKVLQGSTVIEDNRPAYKKMAIRLANDRLTDDLILSNSFCSIGRGQESNDTKDTIDGLVVPKQRHPGAEAHAGTIIGAQFTPGIDARKKDARRYALVSQSEVDKVIHQAFLRLQKSGKVIKGDNDEAIVRPDGKISFMLAGDGSSYDTWMNKDIALRIAKVIRDSFQLNAEQERAFDRYFNHIFDDPLITPHGILGGRHGMPSGTTFTNELDSCYNEILSLAIKHCPVNDIELELQMVTDQGDDAVMILSCVSSTTKEDMLETLSKCYEYLNMKVNPKKQMVSIRKTEFLKRLHTSSRVESYRSYVGSLIGMCNMERSKSWRSEMYSARYIMQAANHYASLEGFDEFMKIVEEGDIFHHIGVGAKEGAYSILQRAGGATKVLKRLGMEQYATHLGVQHSGKEGKLAESLSSAMGVQEANKRLQN